MFSKCSRKYFLFSPVVNMHTYVRPAANHQTITTPQKKRKWWILKFVLFSLIWSPSPQPSSILIAFVRASYHLTSSLSQFLIVSLHHIKKEKPSSLRQSTSIIGVSECVDTTWGEQTKPDSEKGSTATTSTSSSEQVLVVGKGRNSEDKNRREKKKKKLSSTAINGDKRRNTRTKNKVKNKNRCLLLLRFFLLWSKYASR